MLTTLEIQQQAQQLQSRPGAVALVRMSVLAQATSVDDAVAALFAVLMQAANDKADELEAMIKLLDTLRAQKSQIETKIKALMEKIAALKEEGLAAVRDAKQANRAGCRPTPTAVTARTGKLQSYIAEVEAAIAAAGAACPPLIAEQIKRFKALLGELPQLFNLPPQIPGR